MTARGAPSFTAADLAHIRATADTIRDTDNVPETVMTSIGYVDVWPEGDDEAFVTVHGVNYPLDEPPPGRRQRKDNAAGARRTPARPKRTAARRAAVALAPLTVYYQLFDFSGAPVGRLTAAYAGTPASFRRVAAGLQVRAGSSRHSHAESVLLATGADGRPAWEASPNLTHIDPIDLDAPSAAVRNTLPHLTGAAPRRAPSPRVPALAPLTVYYDVFRHDGSRAATLSRSHDGTQGGMRAASLELQAMADRQVSDFTFSGSMLRATDERGAEAWRISPNLRVIEPFVKRVGSDHGRKPNVRRLKRTRGA